MSINSESRRYGRPLSSFAVVSLASLLLGACDLFTAGLGAKVDLDPPEIHVSSPAPNSYINDSFSISGTSSDDVGVSSIVARVTAEDGSVLEYPATLGKDGNWTVDMATARSNAARGLGDGERRIEIVATDGKGRSASTTLAVFIDTIAPTVLVTVPSGYGEGVIVTSTYLSVKGETWDAFPVVTVEVAVLDAGGTEVARKVADGTASWSARFVYGTDFVPENGEYSFRIVASDKAGNENGKFFHVQDVWAGLAAGSLLPAVDSIGKLDQDGTAIGDLTDGGTALLAAKTDALDFSVDFDANKPVVTFSNISSDAAVANNIIGAQVPISGFIMDDKEGIDTSTVSAIVQADAGNDASAGVPAGSMPVRVTAIGDGLTVNFEFELKDIAGEYLRNGRYSIVVSAKDKGGAGGSSMDVPFIIDSSAPVISDAIPSNTSFVSIAAGDDTVAVSTKAEDDNRIVSVLLESMTSAEGSTAFSASAVLADGRWSANLKRPALAADFYIRISAVDDSGKSSRSTLHYFVDNDLPEITITTPEEGSWVGGSAMTATGTADDTGSGVVGLRYALVAGTAAAPADSAWSNANLSTVDDHFQWSASVSFVGITEGAYTLYARSADAAGGKSTVASRGFIFDKDAPSLSETGVGVTGSYLPIAPATTLSLSGIVSDSNGLASPPIVVTSSTGAGIGALTFNAGTGAWSVPVLPLADGVYTYTITATDTVGRTNSISRTVKWDLEVPELAVSNLADGAFITSDSYTIRGIASDSSGLAAVEFSLNDSPDWDSWTSVSSFGQSWTHTVSGMTEGSGQKIRFRARDAAGRIATTSDINFGLDLNPPNLVVSNKTTYNSTFQRADFTLSGTASDINGIKRLQVSLDGGATYETFGGTTSDSTSLNWTRAIPVPASGAADGFKAIRIKAVDNYDKETIESLSVTFDSSAPVFTINNLVDDQLVTATTFAANGTISDNGGSGLSGGSAKFEYSLAYTNDGNDTNDAWTVLTLGASSWTGTLNLGSQGLDKLVYFRATDAVGNASVVGSDASADSVVSVDVDMALPTSTFLHDGSSVWTGTAYKTGSFVLSGVANDTLGLQNLTVTGPANSGVGAGSFSAVTGAWSATVAPTDDGTYAYTVTVTDTAGRTTAIVHSITYDTTPPELNVSNLADGDSISDTSYVIRGTASDSSGLASIEYSLNDGPAWDAWSAVGTPGQSWSQTVSGLAEGSAQQVRFRARDNAGQTSETAVISFGLDLAPPVLTVATIDGTDFDDWIAGTAKNADFNVVGTAYDPNGIKRMEISYDAGGSWTTIATTPAETTDDTSLPWTGSVPVAVGGADDGLKSIRVRATDQYDKQTDVPFGVRFDSSAPSFSVNNLTSGDLVGAVNFAFAGSISDNGGSGLAGGLSAVQYSLSYTNDGNDTNDSWIGLTLGTNTWNGTIAFGSEGLNRTVWLRAIDRLGNATASADIAADAITGIDVDIAAPVSTITHNGADEWADPNAAIYKTAPFTLSGVARDGAAITDGNDVTGVTVSGTGAGIPVFTASTNAWSVAVDPFATGTYAYVITVTDGAGRPTLYTRAVNYDLNDPTVAFNAATATALAGWQRNPDEDIPGNALVSIAGTAGDVGSGLASVQYSLTGGALDWHTINTTSPWTGTVSIPTGNANTLYLRAQDNAGRSTTLAPVTVRVDTEAPTFTETNRTDASFSSRLPVTFTGDFQDNWALHATQALTITAKKNGIAQTPETPTYPTGTTWSYAQSADSDHSDDGLWEITFTAKDASGLTTVVYRSFQIDTTAPALTVTTPTANASADSATYGIVGSASDGTGVGMATAANDVAYSLNDSTWHDMTLTGSSWSASINLNEFTSGQGARTLYVRAVDALGNTNSQSVGFFLDDADPIVAESGVGAATLYTKSDIPLSGTLFDTNDVANIRVTYVKSGDPTVNVALNEAKSGSNTNVAWNVTVGVDTDGALGGDTTGLTDGTYTFTITATDAAIKTAVLTRTVVVDATAPTVPVILSSPGSYVTASLAVNGTASDATSGLAFVRYRIDALAPGTLNNPTEWYGTINVSAIGQGPHTLYVWTEDRVGNLSPEVPQPFVIDREDPELTINVLPAASAYYKNSDVAITGTIDDENGTDPLSVSWTRVSPAASGSLSDTDASATGWSVTLPESAGDGTYTLTFTATDGVGKTKTEVRTVVIDNILPALSLASVVPIIAPVYDGDSELASGDVNGAVTVKGGAGDDNLLKSLGWRLAPTAEAAEDGAFAAVTGNLASWTIGFNSFDYLVTPAADRRLWLRAEDQAGNVKYRDVLLTIDQETDRPVLAVTTPTAAGYVGANHIVRGTVTDDDGIDLTTLQLRWYGHDGTNWSAWTMVDADGDDAAGEDGTVTGTATDISFTFPLPALGADGAKQIEVRVHDTLKVNYVGLGELYDQSGAIAFTQDTADPVPTVATPAADTDVYRFTQILSGSVSDAGLATLHISIDGTGRTLLLSGGSGSQAWTHDTAATWAALSDGRHTVTLEAVDRVGRTATVQRSFYKDTTGPSVTLSNLTAGASPATAVITPDTIRGSTADSYSVLAATIAYSFSDGTHIVTGTTAVSSGSWSVPIPDAVSLDEGPCTITLTMADALGNSTTPAAVGFRLDRTVPAIAFTPPAISLYNGNFPLSGTVTDANDVEKVEYFVNDVLVETDTIVAGTAVSPATAAWGITVDTAAQSDGNYVVKILATDRVGRTNLKTFAYVFDETAPTVTFGGVSPLADGGFLNGSVSVSGSGEDTNGLAAVTPINWAATADTVVAAGVEAAVTASGTPWQPLATAFDTTNGGAHTWENATRRIWVRVQDRAGNFGYAYQDRTIDRDTDRPVVKLTNLAPLGGTTLKNTGLVYGTVGDDDGMAGLVFQVKKAVGDGWTTVAPDGNSWEFDAHTDSVDGDKQLYFRIVDAVGGASGTFTTADASVYAQPRIQTGSAPVTYADAVTPIAFKIDTRNPEIGATITADRFAPFDFAADADTITLINATAFGGSSAQFRLRATATDANGIAALRVTVPGALGSPFSASLTDGTAVSGTWTTGTIAIGDFAAGGSAVSVDDMLANGRYRIVTAGATTWADLAVEAGPFTAGYEFTAERDGLPADGTGTVLFLGHAALNGSVVATIEATDASGLASTATRTVLLDNTAPAITYQSPLTTDIVNGEIDVRGLADDGSGAGIKSIRYQVGYNSDLDPDSASWLNAIASGSMLTWSIGFEGSNKIDSYAIAGEALENDGLWDLPIVIRVEDNAGNVYVSTFSTYVIQVDPSGDKPGALVVYPDPDETNRVMGGKIRAFGTAEDDDGVASVWMQIDVNNDGLFNSADTVTYNPGTGPVTVNWYDYNEAGDAEGRQVSGSVAWNQVLNEYNEFNPSDASIAPTAIRDELRYKILTVGDTDWVSLGATAPVADGDEFTATRDAVGGDADGSGDGTAQALIKRIRFRVRAVDVSATAVIGAWSAPQIIDIDKRVPTIGSGTPLQLSLNGVTQTYQADMWVKSDFSQPVDQRHWRLTGAVEDDSGIQDITITDEYNNILGTLLSEPSWFIQDDLVSPGHYNYILNVPLESIANAYGNLSFTITAEDWNTPTMSNSVDISVNYDNQAPTINAYSGASPVVQSNKTYSVQSSVTESGAGLSRVAIYFARQGASTDRVYGLDGSKATAAARTDITDLSDAVALGDGAGIDMVDGLPRLMITGATRPDTRSLSHASINGNANIRKGGLVKIGGLDRVITAVAGNTIWWADEVPDETSAAIAYALVVDNLSAFSEIPVWTGNTLDSITNDDGDMLIESISKAGALYEWAAAVNSRMIPDGPIEIHYVAYDQAGNWASGSFAANILNNPPRLTKVFLGTDLDGSDSVESGEPETLEYGFAGGGTLEAAASALSSAFKARGRTSVDIEVLQGNGTLRYVFTVGGTTVAGHNLVAFGSTGATTPIDISAGTLGSAPIVEDADNDFVFTVWDSTEEMPTNASQSAVLTVPLRVDVTDSNAPYAGLLPLYWNGAGDNSLYGNSAANGHIDLTSTGDGESDLSGIVSIKGSAWDDQRLTALYLYIGDPASDADAFVFAHAPALETRDWGAPALTYTQVATYASSVWTDELGDLVNDGWQFTVTRDRMDLNGHRVEWRLDWNTAKLPFGADADIVVRVVAEDRATAPSLLTDSNSEFTGTADARTSGGFFKDNALIGQAVQVGMPVVFTASGTEEAYITWVKVFDSDNGEVTLNDDVPTPKVAYRILRNADRAPGMTVDVVPYIDEIGIMAPFGARLPAGMTNNAGASIAGWYPQFRENAGVGITGFNLPYHATTFATNGTLTMNGVAYNPGDITGFADTTRRTLTVSIPDVQTGGSIVVGTNGVFSLNNDNTNSLAYNGDASGSDDDRYIYIDDIAPTVRIAPLGRRYSTGLDTMLGRIDAAKSLAAVTDYNENVVTHGTSPIVRDGHVEYAENSNYSGIGPLTLTADSSTVTFAGHDLVVGQMVQIRSRQTPAAVPPTYDPDGAGPNAAYTVNTVDNHDVFYVASVSGNDFTLAAERGGVAGIFTAVGEVVYIEDPDVSGEVLLRGKVWDNQRISTIAVAITGFDPTGSAGDGAPFTVYAANAVVPNARLNFTIDGAESTLDSQSRAPYGHVLNWQLAWDTAMLTLVADQDAVMTMTITDAVGLTQVVKQSLDVVPYVTGVTTVLSSAYLSNPSVIDRSALGSYPIAASGNVVLGGFNFNGAATVVELDGTGLTPVTGTTKSLSFSIGATAVSGDLIVRTNGIDSINNINDDINQSWNRKPNGANNPLLTDDVAFSVWQFNTVVSNTAVRYPSMRVSKGTGQQVGFIYDSGAQYVRMNVDGSDFQVDMSYTQWYDTGFAIDVSGRPYGGSMNADSGGNAALDMNTVGAGWANFKYYAWNTQAAPGTNNNTVTSAYQSGSKSRAIENAATSAAGALFNSNRVKNPKLATYDDLSGTVYVYMTYYDDTYGQIRYRYGTVSGAAATPTFGGALVNHANNNLGSAAGYHVVAEAADGFKPGQYSAVGVLNDGSVAVMAWYDANGTRLIYSYNDDPNNTGSDAQWQTNAIEIDDGFAGWYVDLAVDGDNGIHIAYYSSSNGDLKYVYLPTYDTTTGIVPVTIDSFLSVGTNLAITTTDDGTNQVPYVSYYAPAYTSTNYSLRTAWRTEFGGSTVPAGADSDAYTGDWEIMTVPVSGKTPKDFTVGIGLRDFTVGIPTPILGYATNLGIESAQLKD
ncbi:MAG: hypothetical protein A2001_02225 [Treponema sp. GWC1_61_84]|nr:MAG: hypothetical protein A2001_02225 [Treponema sp. GWC1_61_84]